MAAPVYATDLTDILLEFSSTTGWTALGGGAAGLNAPETDYFLQGNNCISKNAFASANKGMIYSAGSQTITSGDAVFMWLTHHTPGSLDVEAGTPGGIQMVIGDAASAYKQWDVAGKDTVDYGAPWICAVIDPTVTADDTTGSPSSTTSFFGALWNLPSGGPTKGSPNGIDAFRFGGRLTMTAGDGTSGYATWAGAATYADANIRRWGQLQTGRGSIIARGRMRLGSSGTAVDMRDASRFILFDRLPKVSSTFNEIEIVNASSNIDWTNIIVAQLLGSPQTATRARWVTTNNATVALKSCTFIDMGTWGISSGFTGTSCTWLRCGLVTQTGSTLTSCTFTETNDTAKALVVDTIANVTGCTFNSSGTKYAIEGFSTAGSYNLTDLTFNGYAASDGSTGNEAIHVLATTGTVTLNISGGTTPSVHTEGATISKVINPVTTEVTVQTTAGAAIQNARVLVRASAGPLPFNASVTIANSGTTATVTHTAHGILTNDKVEINGASHWQNNGVFQITVTGANTYTYTLPSDPGSSPTGTITSTWVALEGLTNASGYISASRSFGAAQPITGRARKSSASPYYKTGGISGSINASSGFSVTLALVSDE